MVPGHELVDTAVGPAVGEALEQDSFVLNRMGFTNRG